jgi:hypothetical protein
MPGSSRCDGRVPTCVPAYVNRGLGQPSTWYDRLVGVREWPPARPTERESVVSVTGTYGAISASLLVGCLRPR